jgi:hypothetical protein
MQLLGGMGEGAGFRGSMKNAQFVPIEWHQALFPRPVDRASIRRLMRLFGSFGVPDMSRQIALGLQGRHASHPGRGHGLAVDIVCDVAGSKTPGTSVAVESGAVHK